MFYDCYWVIHTQYQYYVSVNILFLLAIIDYLLSKSDTPCGITDFRLILNMINGFINIPKKAMKIHNLLINQSGSTEL